MALTLAACVRAPAQAPPRQAAPVRAPAAALPGQQDVPKQASARPARLAAPLPLARQESFPDLTDRHRWTIRYPEGWLVSTTGSGRWIREDQAGLVSVSLNQTTLQGTYTARSVVPLLVEALGQRAYSSVQVTAINDLQGSVSGSTAVEVYLTAVHGGAPVRAAWAIEVLDLTAQSLWPLSAVTIWALEVPPDQVELKLATLVAILSSARLDVDPDVGDLSWYGEIGKKWADALGR